MATIIDSLLVTLGLDASGMKKGADEAVAAQSKVERSAKESAAAKKRREAEEKRAQKEREDAEKKAAKEREAREKQAAAALAKVRNEVLSLAAAYVGAKAIAGFGEQLIGLGANLARVSGTLDVSRRDLKGWQGAAEEFGASAEQVEGAFRTINKLQQGFKVGDIGGLKDYAQTLASIGGHIDTAKLTARGLSSQQVLFELAKETQALSLKDATLALEKLGIDEDVARALHSGNVALAESIQKYQRLHPDLEKASDESLKISKTWVGIKHQIEGVGESVLTEFAPAIEAVQAHLSSLLSYASEHVPAVTALVSGLSVAVTALGARALAGTLVTLGNFTGGLGLAATAAARLIGLLGNAGLVGAAGAAGYAIGALLADGLDQFITKLTGAQSTLGTFVYDLLHPGEKARGAAQIKYDALGNPIGEEEETAAPIGPTLEVLRRQDAAIRAGGTGTKVVPVEIRPGVPSVTPQIASPSVIHQVAAAVVAVDRSLPRGLRNNNPGNLNYAGQAGATKEQGPGGRFAVFKTLDDGIRALARQLQLYGKRGVDTVRGIITKYAPRGENNTEAYVQAVVKKLGVSAETHLDLMDRDVLKRLIEGITRMEVGAKRVTAEQIDRALNVGARASASSASSTVNNQATNNQSVETHINGPININAPQAKNDGDVGNAIGDRLGSYAYGSMANMGQS